VQRLLTIGEVADSVGIRTSALRFYEEAGLVVPAARVSGQRRYDESAIGELTVIRFCQQLGFSLGEIRELLTPPRGKRQKQRWRELVDDKLEELDAVVARAKTMRTILERSRDCDCVDLEECAARCATTAA
jgi:MerR family redox-sensitive transcriptional activator SoxR